MLLFKWFNTAKLLLLFFFFLLGVIVYGQELSTVSEVYDFDIDDEFHIYQYSGNYLWPDGLERIRNIEIHDKYYSPDNDTLFYVQIVFEKSRWYYAPWEYDYYFRTVSITNLDSTIIDLEVLIDTAYSIESKYNGRKINFGNSENPTINVEYVEGCGLAFYEKIIHAISWSYINEYKLRYFSKGDETWGDPIYARMESRVGEIFDYEAGDVFHYKDSTIVGKEVQDTPSKYINIEIVDKFFSPGQDTVFYIRDYKCTNGENYRDTIFYTELSSFIHIDTNYVDSVFSDGSLYFERKGNQIRYNFQQGQSYHSHRCWYVEGCGLAYSHEHVSGKNDHKTLFTLIYYKKGGEEWGYPFNVTIPETGQFIEPLQIYPNPSRSIISIVLPARTSRNTYLAIYHINSQPLITQLIAKPKTEIDISHLPAGIYIVKVWNDKDVMIQRVIKQ